MTYRKNKTNAEYKARWLSAYEDELIARRPDLRGKVDWDTATFFFNSGETFESAAKKAAEH